MNGEKKFSQLPVVCFRGTQDTLYLTTPLKKQKGAI